MSFDAKTIAEEGIEVLRSFSDLCRTRKGLAFILYYLGFDRDPDNLTVSVQLEQLIEKIDLLANTQSIDIESPAKVIQAIGTIIEIQQEIFSLFQQPTQLGLTLTKTQELIEFLFMNYLSAAHPALFRLFLLLKVVSLEEFKANESLESSNNNYIGLKINWSNLNLVLTNPSRFMYQNYGWGTQDFDYKLLLIRLSNFFEALGLRVQSDDLDPLLIETLELSFNNLSPWHVEFLILVEENEKGLVRVGVAAMPSKGTSPSDFGIALMPIAEGKLTESIGLTDTVTIHFEGLATIAGGIIALLKPHEGLVVKMGFLDQQVGMGSGGSIRLEWLPLSEYVLFGNQTGSHLSVPCVFSQLGFFLGDVSFELWANEASFVIQADEGDGFLQKILPKDGIQVNFSIGVGWSNKKGLYFRGGSGLETTLPINKNLFDVLLINSVYLALIAKESEISAAAAASVTLKMGPVVVAIEQMGLKANFSFPERGGNLGPVNLEIGFKPPKGAGLVIDASAVVGAGFLEFDPDNQMYSGFVYLEIVKKISVTAVGLITTRMPDGSPGFSLLALIAVKFSPGIQLGYGFTLNGIGGILGINRTVTVEVLRTGLRNGTLGSILFPSDPKKNIARIISDLKTVFPPAEGRFVFGPMVILGWGSNEPIKLELGIILELPDPVRLLILGRLSLKLPDEKNPVVRLKLDSLGVIEFATGDVSLDAVLYDSEIKGFTITGEMALRANFSASPGFLLSVGGFHPAFKTPPGFPTLQRVAISLATGDNPRLRLAAYMAITTNTVQFGGALEILVKAGDFNLEGQFSFDALIQFDPFGLAIGLGAMIAVKSGKTVLLCIKLDLNLTGPTPWHAWGEAVFKILFFEIRLPIDFKSGEEQIPEPPAPVNITPMMIAALQESTNWSTQLPPGEHPLVVFREQVRGSGIMVHPLAMLQVSQRVAPLNENLYKFGNATLEGGVQHFKLSVDGKDLQESDYAKDWFAPAHFREMTDDEKIAADSFEQKDAGIRFTQEGFSCGTAVVEDEMEYETKVSGATEMAVSSKKTAKASISKKRAGESSTDVQSYRLTNEFLEQVACLGAVGQSLLLKTGNAKYQSDGAKSSVPIFNVKPRSYIVVGSDATSENRSNSMRRKSTDSDFKRTVESQETPVVESYTAAMELLKKKRSAAPTTRTRLKIVPL